MEPRNEGPKMGVAKTSQTNTARPLAVTQVHHGNPRGLVSQTYRMSSLLVFHSSLIWCFLGTTDHRFDEECLLRPGRRSSNAS